MNPVNFIAVDRHWFLTWTTYGTWLPGSERGFVGEVRDESGQFVNFNEPGTLPAMPNAALLNSAERNLKSKPILLERLQATALLDQFQETCRIRGWLLIAAGIMKSHIHLVVGVPGDPDPEKVLGDLKAYGSRKLNRQMSRPESGTWWTVRGSKRKLPDDRAIEAAVNYIRNQQHPLIIWTRESGLLT